MTKPDTAEQPPVTASYRRCQVVYKTRGPPHLTFKATSPALVAVGQVHFGAVTEKQHFPYCRGRRPESLVADKQP